MTVSQFGKTFVSYQSPSCWNLWLLLPQFWRVPFANCFTISYRFSVSRDIMSPHPLKHHVIPNINCSIRNLYKVRTRFHLLEYPMIPNINCSITVTKTLGIFWNHAEKKGSLLNLSYVLLCRNLHASWTWSRCSTLYLQFHMLVSTECINPHRCA